MLGKHNPKDFLRKLEQAKKQVENKITDSQWLEYAKTLYERPEDRVSLPTTTNSDELFSNEDITLGIKRLASGKAQDIDRLQAEFLKWGTNLLTPHISNIFNMVTQGCFSTEWTTSVVIPLHKSGDVNNPSNYNTIMINPLLSKLYKSMVEQRINK